MANQHNQFKTNKSTPNKINTNTQNANIHDSKAGYSTNKSINKSNIYQKNQILI